MAAATHSPIWDNVNDASSAKGLIPLYVAHSLDQLKATPILQEIESTIGSIDNNKISLKKFMDQISDLLRDAQDSMKCGDEEMAYIRYFAYLKSWNDLEDTELVQTLKNDEDIHSHITLYENCRSVVVGNIDKLERSLKRRYKERSKEALEKKYGHHDSMRTTLKSDAQSKDQERGSGTDDGEPSSKSQYPGGARPKATTRNIVLQASKFPPKNSSPQPKVQDLKDLHMGNSVDGLDQVPMDEEVQRKLESAKTLEHYDKYFFQAKSIYEKAIKAQKEGDEELAYVLFRHYVKVFDYLEEWQQFQLDKLREKVDKNAFEALRGRKTTALNWIQRLVESLEQRYEEKRKKEEEYMATLRPPSQSPNHMVDERNEKPRAFNGDEVTSHVSQMAIPPKKVEIKPLYLATYFEELERSLIGDEEIYKKLEAAQDLGAYDKLIDLLDRFYEEATRAKARGDQEMAYVQFSNYKKSCHAMEDWPDFEPDLGKKKIDPQIYEDKLKESVWEVDRLGKELRRRYAKLSPVANGSIASHDHNPQAEASLIDLHDYKVSKDPPYASSFNREHMTDDERGFGENVGGGNMVSEYQYDTRQSYQYTSSNSYPYPSTPTAQRHKYEDVRSIQRSNYLGANLESLQAPNDLKPLYMTECLEELDGFVKEAEDEISGKLMAGREDMKIYFVAIHDAENVLQDGIKAYKDGDQELAYIKLATFCKSCDKIAQELSPYTEIMNQSDDQILDKLHGLKLQAEEYKEDLYKSLTERYKTEQQQKLLDLAPKKEAKESKENNHQHQCCSEFKHNHHHHQPHPESKEPINRRGAGYGDGEPMETAPAEHYQYCDMCPSPFVYISMPCRHAVYCAKCYEKHKYRVIRCPKCKNLTSHYAQVKVPGFISTLLSSLGLK